MMTREINYKINRGRIYMADLGGRKGSIQGGSRPVIVISNPINNKFSPTINVIPLTSKVKNNIPVHVSIGRESGLEVESTALTEQVLTINKSQLTRMLGQCTRDKMKEIAKAIILQVHLEDDLQVV